MVEVAKDCAVLNADNEHTLKMAARTEARHICYVTRRPEHPLVREHIKLGKRAVTLEKGLNGDQIVIYDNGNQMPLIWTHLIPATVEGKALHNVENAMFTAAMAHALGLTLDQIRTGLRTFDNTFFQSPGRMNIFDEHGFRVILDYGHNEAAVGAMVDLVERLQPLGQAASSAPPAPATGATRTCATSPPGSPDTSTTTSATATTTPAAARPTRSRS